MNILVIGGLGYIGSDLVHKLEHVGNVTILDCNAYDSPYEPEKADIIDKNVMNCEPDDVEGYDKVVILTDPDIEEFYSFKHYRGYLNNYSMALKCIIENCEKSEFYYVYGYRQHNELHKEYSISFLDKCSSFKNFKPVWCPTLYGDNVCVRSDTVINSMVYDYVTSEQFFVEGDAMEIVDFEHVFTYTEALVDFMMSGTTMPKYDRLPLQLLASKINWMIDAKSPMSMGAKSVNTDDTGVCEIRYCNSKRIKYHISQFVTAIQNGLTSELLLPRSNRRRTMLNSIESYCMNSRMLSV
jgi:hypothetical protein